VRWSDKLASALAVVVLVLSAVVLVSYRTGAEWLRRWDDPPMAVNTALCFLLLSLAFVLVTRPPDGPSG